MQIFVNIPANASNKAYFREKIAQRHRIVFKDEIPENEAFEAFCSSEMVVGNPPAAWFSPQPKNLRWWQLETAGFDAYTHLSLSVPVCNVGPYFAVPCAETTLAGIMALYRRIDHLAVLQTQKHWVGAALRPSLRLLSGQNVVVLGAGTIAQILKKMLQGFGCNITLMARQNALADIHSVAELETILPQTDLVISTLPGVAKDFFTANLIGLMNPHSVFANVGRGSTVDETALITALQTGQIAGAVLDVTATEPLPTDSPLWTMPNVLLTQHTAGGSMTEERGKFDLFLENLARFERGEALQNQILLARGY